MKKYNVKYGEQKINMIKKMFILNEQILYNIIIEKNNTKNCDKIKFGISVWNTYIHTVMIMITRISFYFDG